MAYVPFFLVTAFLFLTDEAGFSRSIDSLEIVLQSNGLSANDRVGILNELSWKYIETNPVKAQKLAAQAIALVQKEDNTKLLAVAYYRLGTALYNLTSSTVLN